MLGRQSGNRALRRADGRARDRFGRGPRPLAVEHPVAIEVIGAFCHALVSLPRVDQPGVASVQPFEEMVLRQRVGTGRLDMDRVGIFGHSLGGATALLSCHNDARYKAGMDIDGAPLGSVASETVAKPFLFLLSDHSTESLTPETPDSIRNAMANIRKVFYRMPADRRMMVSIRGANHYLFSDNAAMLKSPLLMRAMRMLGVLRIDGRRQVEITAQCIRTFFDVHLSGAPASELTTQLHCPEIEISQ